MDQQDHAGNQSARQFLLRMISVGCGIDAKGGYVQAIRIERPPITTRNMKNGVMPTRLDRRHKRLDVVHSAVHGWETPFADGRTGCLAHRKSRQMDIAIELRPSEPGGVGAGEQERVEQMRLRRAPRQGLGHEQRTGPRIEPGGPRLCYRCRRARLRSQDEQGTAQSYAETSTAPSNRARIEGVACASRLRPRASAAFKSPRGISAVSDTRSLPSPVNISAIK